MLRERQISSQAYHQSQSNSMLSVSVTPSPTAYYIRFFSCPHTEVFALALPRLTGRGAIYRVNLLVRYPSLDPLITGVDPLPASSNPRTTAQCLDVLLGRGGVNDNFTRLLPVLRV